MQPLSSILVAIVAVLPAACALTVSPNRLERARHLLEVDGRRLGAPELAQIASKAVGPVVFAMRGVLVKPLPGVGENI